VSRVRPAHRQPINQVGLSSRRRDGPLHGGRPGSPKSTAQRPQGAGRTGGRGSGGRGRDRTYNRAGVRGADDDGTGLYQQQQSLAEHLRMPSASPSPRVRATRRVMAWGLRRVTLAGFLGVAAVIYDAFQYGSPGSSPLDSRSCRASRCYPWASWPSCSAGPSTAWAARRPKPLASAMSRGRAAGRRPGLAWAAEGSADPASRTITSGFRAIAHLRATASRAAPLDQLDRLPSGPFLTRHWSEIKMAFGRTPRSTT
jgi:hypothetical protein